MRRTIGLALLLGLVVSLIAITGCQGQGNQSQNTLPYTENTSTATTGTANSSSVYTVNLMPLNNSGVEGSATVTVKGNSITVRINATGLEPNQKHEQHIHGFRDKKASTLPQENATVTDEQAEESVGPPLLSLEPFPTADSNGVIRFNETFDTVQMIYPLQNRAIELHGIARNGEYDFTMPVAVGLLKPATSNRSLNTTQGGPHTGTQPGQKGTATTGPNPNQNTTGGAGQYTTPPAAQQNQGQDTTLNP